MSTTPPTDEVTQQTGQKEPPAFSQTLWNLERIVEVRRNANWIPSFVENTINDLEPQELGRALVKACFSADLSTAKAIWEMRGPFVVECQEINNQILIDGEVVEDDSRWKRLCDREELEIEEVQELMEWMPTVGLGFMCGVGTDTALLLQPNRIETPIQQLSWASHFDGSLPVFSFGSVDQPELMLALDEKVRNSHYADSFDQILCWVEEATLREFQGEFDAFEPIHSLYLKRSVAEGDEVRIIPMSEVTEQVLSDVSRKSIRRGNIVHSDAPWSYQGLTLEILPVEAGNPADNMVLAYQADAVLKHGFKLKPGHVLCRTRVSFLREFSLGPVRQDNLSKAIAFAASYFPLDLMMLRVPQPKLVMESGCVRLINGLRLDSQSSYLIQNLYKALGNDSQLQPHLQKSLTPALLGYLGGIYCDVTLQADSMLGLFQGFGIDNKGYRIELDYLDLQRLHDAGFKFSNDSSTINPIPYSSAYAGPEHRNDSAKTEVRLDLGSMDDAMSTSFEDALFGDGDVQEKQVETWERRFINAFDMNLWPVQSQRPSSVLDALGIAGKRKEWGESHFELALLAFIDQAGLEACAQVAKTEQHWDFMKRHFGQEALSPYIREIPRTVRGGILMDAIGL
jgi:hypothetical protein